MFTRGVARAAERRCAELEAELEALRELERAAREYIQDPYDGGLLKGPLRKLDALKEQK
jgi:hypothetical protein